MRLDYFSLEIEVTTSNFALLSDSPPSTEYWPSSWVVGPRGYALVDTLGWQIVGVV